ncbi:hypothetical protein PENANT_c010G11597 [Penicillium antarcticum]|uniref:Uncharacterized protein n=1 Tax=Penicillium antarcticum TaxID=416450 RepID=A0A1V6Q8B2_9EURO|nr:hypothetical protein PENANT_c010G11597 [Penicillium antarcticum]
MNITNTTEAQLLTLTRTL